MYKYKVVCGFNGTVYSKHKTEEAAYKAAQKERNALSLPCCGSLAYYVEVVGINARFTNIADADNEFGCCQTQQKFWKE